MKADCFHPRNALSIVALLALLAPTAAFGQEISAEQDAGILKKVEDVRTMCGDMAQFAWLVHEALAEGLKPEAIKEGLAAELDPLFVEEIGKSGLQDAKERREVFLALTAAALAAFGRCDAPICDAPIEVIEDLYTSCMDWMVESLCREAKAHACAAIREHAAAVR